MSSRGLDVHECILEACRKQPKVCAQRLAAKTWPQLAF